MPGNIPLDLSIIIVNWNTKDYLSRCLATISKIENINYETIVVDNASFDGSSKLCEEYFPDIRYIQSHINGGFSYANNIGYSFAKGSFLLFLNPDTEVRRGSMEKLYEVLKEDETIGAAGPILLNIDNTVQDTCVQSFPTVMNAALDSRFLRKVLQKTNMWGNKILFSPGNDNSEVDAVSGACMMVNRGAFERVGKFTGDYFMYAEDRDLCYKLKCEGRKVVLVKKALVTHHGGGSTDSDKVAFLGAAMRRESLFRYMKANKGKGYALVYRVIMALAAGFRLNLLALAYLFFQGDRREKLKESMKKWLYILTWALKLKKFEV